MNDQESSSSYSSSQDEELSSSYSSKNKTQDDLISTDNFQPAESSQSYTDFNRILILCRRGVSPSIRHFLPDFYRLIQNPVKSPKFKGKNYIALNNLADEKNCSVILLFETRHSTEHYLWFSLPPGGPTMCFFFENFHKIEEFHFNGKCSPDTKPLLFFDPAFNSNPALGIAKVLLKQAFGAPFAKGRKFVDTAISFFYKDDHIWVVRYQIMFDTETPVLIEAGPRFCLQPVLILHGSFCGKEIYKNPNFIPPHKRPRPTKVDQNLSGQKE